MQQATVWSPNMGKVKLRSLPSDDCDIYWNIPSGTRVYIVDPGDEYTRIIIGNRDGYIKTKYLLMGEVLFNTTETDSVVVNRKQLEKVYNELGTILGVCG